LKFFFFFFLGKGEVFPRATISTSTLSAIWPENNHKHDISVHFPPL
jgi:hypothetical protein